MFNLKVMGKRVLCFSYICHLEDISGNSRLNFIHGCTIYGCGDDKAVTVTPSLSSNVKMIAIGRKSPSTRSSDFKYDAKGLKVFSN